VASKPLNSPAIVLGAGTAINRAELLPCDSGIVLSIAVQHGVDPETIRRALFRDSQGRACGQRSR
jgi:hypothetical protein